MTTKNEELLNIFRGIIAKQGWQCREMTEELVDAAEIFFANRNNKSRGSYPKAPENPYKKRVDTNPFAYEIRGEKVDSKTKELVYAEAIDKYHMICAERILHPLYTSPPDHACEIETVRSILKDDAFAISFQSIAQYRKALLEAIK